MSKIPGSKIDTRPITRLEYLLILNYLAAHWRLFFELLWETGIRVGEALALTRQDLNKSGVDITREKRADNHKDHLPLSAMLYSRLFAEAYHHKDIHVFPFTAAGANYALEVARNKAGVKWKVHPHSYRHAFGYRAAATDFGDKTPLAHMIRVQHMMGHKSIKSTEVYFEPPPVDIQNGFNIMNKDE
jgi:integrase